MEVQELDPDLRVAAETFIGRFANACIEEGLAAGFVKDPAKDHDQNAIALLKLGVERAIVRDEFKALVGL